MKQEKDNLFHIETVKFHEKHGNCTKTVKFTQKISELLCTKNTLLREPFNLPELLLGVP